MNSDQDLEHHETLERKLKVVDPTSPILCTARPRQREFKNLDQVRCSSEVMPPDLAEDDIEILGIGLQEAILERKLKATPKLEEWPTLGSQIEPELQPNSSLQVEPGFDAGNECES